MSTSRPATTTDTTPTPSGVGAALAVYSGLAVGLFVGTLWAGGPYSGNGFNSLDFVAFILLIYGLPWVLGGILLLALMSRLLQRLVGSTWSTSTRSMTAVWLTTVLLLAIPLPFGGIDYAPLFLGGTALMGVGCLVAFALLRRRAGAGRIVLACLAGGGTAAVCLIGLSRVLPT